MKIHSIQFKFITTVISAIIAISVFAGGLSTYEVDNYVQQHTKELIEVSCSNEAAQVNDTLNDIEKSVKIMESYLLSMFQNSTDITDPDTQNKIIQSASEMFIDIAANTEGALAYYFRFAQEISNSTSGIFHSKLNGGDEYIHLEPTDISLYEKDDIEHVGWYWIPYEAGHPVWLDPYYNQNNNTLMISYVTPLYHNNQFFGVVGMDFDYTLLIDRIHKIEIFQHGFAHLELNDIVIHVGKEHSVEEDIHNTTENHLRVSQKLTNGMELVLYANADDIFQIRLSIALKILISTVLIMLLFLLIVVFIVKNIIKPIKKLTNAAIKMSNGDYNIEIEHSNTYEIQQLSMAFENMSINLSEHKKLQHLLAYRDPLTGLRNTTSYKEWIIDFNKKIKEEDVAFGLAVLDINYLKEANDTYGHNIGNKLIKASAQIISDTFKRSPVFRIGGDEFLVILQGRDLECYNELITEFESKCENTHVEDENICLTVSIAKGFSIYNPSTDIQFADVFKRADNAMYVNKKYIKMSHI